MLTRLVTIIDRLSGATGLFGASLVLPIAAVMFYEVVLRFFFDLPTFWAYELTYMMTGAHFALGIAYVMREEQHIRIDFLYERFSPRVKATIDVVINAGFLLPTITWMTWLLTDKAIDAYLVNELSGESEWNPIVWPVYSAVAFGFFVFTLQIISDTIKRSRLLRTGKPEA